MTSDPLTSDTLKSSAWKSDTWKWIAVGICLVLFAADTVWQPQDKPNRMVFFELHRGDRPAVIGMMRDDLLKLQGRGANRLQHALSQGQQLTVWQYALRKTEDGSYQAMPDKQIELTSADAPLITFGARIRLPDN
jgi:hypothetical protein